jgi:hypothetical protein
MASAAGITALERSSSPANIEGLRRDGPLGRLMAYGWCHEFHEGLKF